MDSEATKRFSRAFMTAMHALHHLAGSVMKNGSIPLAQYRLLMLLYTHGAVSIKELSQILGIAQSTASELAGRALEGGLLERLSDPADGRRTLYALSARSRTLLKSRKREMNKIYAAVLEPLSPADQQRLLESFETIAGLLSLHEIR